MRSGTANLPLHSGRAPAWLFSRMVRQKDVKGPQHGVATLGALGGMGLAALFEAV